QAMSRERQRPEQRRGAPKRMDRRADVVQKTGQRQFGGACPSTHARLSFEDDDLAAGLGNDNGCGKTVRSSTYHDRVGSTHMLRDYIPVAQGSALRREARTEVLRYGNRTEAVELTRVGRRFHEGCNLCI